MLFGDGDAEEAGREGFRGGEGRSGSWDKGFEWLGLGDFFLADELVEELAAVGCSDAFFTR